MKEKLAEMAIQIFAVESMVYRSGGKYRYGDGGGFGVRAETKFRAP